MKKQLRIFISMVFFVIGFCVLFLKTSEVFRLKTNDNIDMIHSFYELDRNSLDVIGLGSSHLYFSLSPNELWGKYKIASYLMGSPEQSMACSYFLLKEALNYQKPKVVLLETYHFLYKKLYVSEGMLRQTMDGMRFGKVKREMINTLLPNLTWKEKLSYYIPFLLYHNRWDSLHRYDIIPRNFTYGSKIGNKTTVLEDPGTRKHAKEIPEISLKYFKKIEDICKKNQIDLIVYAAPCAFFTGKRYVRYYGLNLSIEQYLQKRDIPFLFLQNEEGLRIDYSTDFFDGGHLNKYGQKKATDFLGEYLSENYKFPDHRGDPAYKSWDRNYEKYLEHVQ